jgi:hypothetical protein
MAVKKIPTYETSGKISSGFKAPKLKDGTVSILKSINSLAQDHLDIKAAEEGQQEGYQAVDKGTVDINEAMAKPNTIRGAAFKKGASSSFIAKTEQEYETQLTELKNNNLYDSEKFNTEALKLRETFLKKTPASLQQAIGTGFDKQAGRFNTQINTNSFLRQEAEDLKIETDRLVDLTNKIHEGILAGDDDVEELVAKFMFHTNQLYNVDKKIDIQVLEQFQNSFFKSVITAEIKKSFEDTPNISKEEFIKELEEDGYKSYLKDLKVVYEDEIKKGLPQFKIPETLDPRLFSEIISDLKSDFREMVEARKSESALAQTNVTKTLNNALENDTPINEAMPLPNLYKIAEDNFWDNETLESYLNLYKQAELTQTYTKNHKTMSVDELTDTIDQYKILEGLLDNTKPEDQIKKLALMDSIKTLEDRNEKLKAVVGNANPYKVLGTDGIIDFNNISELTDGDELKKRRINAANKLGVPVEMIPIVDQNEISALTSALASNDINKVNDTINLLTTLKLDNNIDIVQEILEAEGVSTRATAIEIALELPDNAERSMMLEAIIRKDEIKTILDSRKDGSKGSKDQNNAKKLSDHIEKMNINSIGDKAKAIEFYEIITNYQMVEGLDFDNAMKKADELYNRSFRPIEYAEGKTIIVPHSLYEGNNVDKSIEKVNLMKSNPVEYNFLCDESQTFEQCESAFANALELDREGSQLILKSSVTDADLGTSGQTFSMAGEQNVNGEFAVMPMIVEIDPNKQVPVQTSKKFAKGWNINIDAGAPVGGGSWKKEFANENIIKEIPDFEKQRDVNDVDIKDIQKSISELVDNPDAFKNKRDEMLAYEQKEEDTRKFYSSITQKAGFVDSGAFNIAANEFGQEDVVNGILLKNAQAGSKWTEWELNYLSKFDDLEGLENPAVQKYVMNNWKTLQAQGGYAGKGTGAKLAPGASLYLLVKEAERSL